jgi:hypothetical protein
MLHEGESKKRTGKLWEQSKRARILSIFCLSVWLVVSGCSSSQKDSASPAKAEQASSTEGQQAAAVKDKIAVTSNQSVKTTGSGLTSYTTADKGAADANSASGAQGTSGFSAVNSAESWDRKVIYKGNLTMEVPNYEAAQVEINNLVTLSGGYILQFVENQSTADQSGNYVIKVPASGFSSFIRDLEKIKTVSKIRRNIQGQDVSEEYVDLDSRLKAKQVVEARLLAFMEKATKTDELLSFSNELANVQEVIEQFKGRMRYLDQNVAMATVEIRLYEHGAAKNNEKLIGDSTVTKTKNALNGSLHALKVIAQGLIIFAAAMLPVLIVVAIIVIPLIYFIRKRARQMSTNVSKPADYNQKIDTEEPQPKDAQ